MVNCGTKWEMIFLGTYQHCIDEKNRLSLPTKIINKLNSRCIIVSKGFDGCLELRTQDEFNLWVNKILSYSQNKKDTRILLRQILANSTEIEIDKTNRILIPETLKNIAHLNKNVIVIGLGNKLEI